jgi:hypothetical protein
VDGEQPFAAQFSNGSGPDSNEVADEADRQALEKGEVQGQEALGRSPRERRWATRREGTARGPGRCHVGLPGGEEGADCGFTVRSEAGHSRNKHRAAAGSRDQSEDQVQHHVPFVCFLSQAFGTVLGH